MFLDWITHDDVTSNTLIEAFLTEDEEGCGQAAFQVLPLLELVIELGRLGKAMITCREVVVEWFGLLLGVSCARGVTPSIAC